MRAQLLAQTLERPWVLPIEIQIEDSLREGQTVVLQVVVQPRPKCSEVGNPGGD